MVDMKQPVEKAELDMQREDHQFQLEMQKQQHNHENELKNKEIGWLGKFFGAEDNAARNMAMTVIILVSGRATVFSVCVIFNSNIGDDLIPNVWSKVSPVITLALGYIFGKNKD